VSRRGDYSGDRREAKTNHGDAVEVLGYVAQGRATAVHRRAYWVPPRQASRVVGFVLPAGLIHGDDISGTPSAIHSPRTQLGLAATRIMAQGGRRWRARDAGNLIHFGHCTMALLHQSA
jgi:hypothetical protein